MSPRRHRQRGLTLVELMIAMVLALTVAAAVLSVFTQSRHSFRQDQNVLRMQDDARHALRELAFDLTMAGHYADLLVPSAITQDGTLVVNTDCGPAGVANWVYMTRDTAAGQNLSVTTVDNATASNANASHSCIGTGEFESGTDVIAVKRVAGNSSTIASSGQVYLRTNGTVGLLYREPSSAPAITVPAPFATWEYRPRVYYIRNFAVTPGDGIPTLCRKVLQQSPATMTTECIAAGIEDLQLEFGIDTSGNSDADVFLANPTLAQLQAAVSVRIFLLARTTKADPQYENTKTYSVSNAPAQTPNDRFHRRVVSATVGLKNLRSLRRMGT